MYVTYQQSDDRLVVRVHCGATGRVLLTKTDNLPTTGAAEAGRQAALIVQAALEEAHGK